MRDGNVAGHPPPSVLAWAASAASRRAGVRTRNVGIIAIALSAALALRSGDVAAQEPEREAPRLDERTAYTIGASRLKLGLLALEYGVTDQLSIGTEPPAWVVRTVLPLLIPNLHAKLRLFQHEQLAVSIEAAGYYASLTSDDGAGGSLVSTPMSLVASVPLARALLIHPHVTYIFTRAFGAGDLDDADVSGAVATRALQAGAMLEYRVSRVTSLTALGRYQLYTGTLVFSGRHQTDPYTSVELDAALEPRGAKPWQAVGGVALTWEHVRLVLGVGYGSYFVPGFEIALSDHLFFPDLSFAVVL